MESKIVDIHKNYAFTEPVTTITVKYHKPWCLFWNKTVYIVDTDNEGV